MLFRNVILAKGFNANVASAVYTRHSRDAFVMVQKSFGLKFAHVSGAPEALVSFFLNGGQPAGKDGFSFFCVLWIDLWWEPLKGLSLNTSHSIKYLLTVDLRLET